MRVIRPCESGPFCISVMRKTGQGDKSSQKIYHLAPQTSSVTHLSLSITPFTLIIKSMGTQFQVILFLSFNRERVIQNFHGTPHREHFPRGSQLSHALRRLWSHPLSLCLLYGRDWCCATSDRIISAKHVSEKQASRERHVVLRRTLLVGRGRGPGLRTIGPVQVIQ